MSDEHNVFGQAYALTVLTPILADRESSLTRFLAALEGGAASPLARVKGTHFARWVVIDDVVYEGTRQRRDHLALGRLLFTSNFDGSVEPYLEALRTGLGETADAIWNHCVGYPGSKDAGAFARYMRGHQIESALFFSAYGERTVEDVIRGLEVRRQVMDLALRSQGMPAPGLQAAFRETFGG